MLTPIQYWSWVFGLDVIFDCKDEETAKRVMEVVAATCAMIEFFTEKMKYDYILWFSAIKTGQPIKVPHKHTKKNK